MELNVTRTFLPSLEEFAEELKPLWDSRIVTNMGCKHDAFQKALENYLGCNVTLFANGHLALEAAIRCLGLPQGSEVITSPFTFVSTTHAIVRCGLKPVFCDVRPQDGTICPDCIEKLITPSTSAILPILVYGNMCEVERIGSIASSHGLKLLYDAAHAFGVRYKGQSAACFGDAAILSFHATKLFSTIEGGAVCYRDDSMRQSLDDQKNFGIRDTEHCEAIGGNAKMNELQAAMGICNLRHFPEVLASRKAITSMYREMLKTRPVRPFPLVEDRFTEPNYSYFPVLFDSMAERDKAHTALEAAGIGTRKYFWPLTSELGCYKGRFDPGCTPVARNLSSRILCLPLFPEMTEEDVRRIVTSLPL